MPMFCKYVTKLIAKSSWDDNYMLTLVNRGLETSEFILRKIQIFSKGETN
jgi:hypothetical protein